MADYQVLARKWRPKTFADLVGQEHVVKALQNALDKGRLHHAYLLTGTRGVGKTTIARILAKSLNCTQAQHGEPCGVCQTCQDIDAGRFVDLLEIDAASNTGIDNIREVLENAQYAPTVGKYKVYIIDEVHMLSKSAFNAMLKTLEEPPEHVKFILATTDPHKVPITVLSRCLQFVLRNMTVKQISGHLSHILKAEQIVYEPTALVLLAQAAHGSMRDALSLLDQAIALGSGSVKEGEVREMIGAVDQRYLYELLTFLMENNGEAMIVKAQEMARNAVGFDGALNELALLLQRLALLKAVPTAIAPDDPERERLQQLSQYFSDEQIQLYYQCAIHGKQDLSLAPDEYAGFVMTLLRMLAFAPFAAKHIPTDAVIEGTQLQNPPMDDGEKKPLLPESIAPNTFRQPKVSAELPIQSQPPVIQPKIESNWLSAPIDHQAEMVEILPVENDALPAFAAQNWGEIADYIAHHIAAAQMLLQHTAWLDYNQGVLHLAIAPSQESYQNHSEYCQRIGQALEKIYGLSIQVKLKVVATEQMGETLWQYRQRKQQEKWQQMREICDDNPFVQELRQAGLFGDWIDGLFKERDDKDQAWGEDKSWCQDTIQRFKKWKEQQNYARNR